MEWTDELIVEQMREEVLPRLTTLFNRYHQIIPCSVIFGVTANGELSATHLIFPDPSQTDEQMSARVRQACEKLSATARCNCGMTMLTRLDNKPLECVVAGVIYLQENRRNLYLAPILRPEGQPPHLGPWEHHDVTGLANPFAPNPAC